MSYIGTPPSNAFTSLLKQDFSTSATTGYTLDHAVNNANDIALFINFVRQEPTAGYAASGTSLVLTSATASSDDMYCVYLGQALQTVNPANASVGISQLSATGTKNSTTFLRGDNTFAEAGGGKLLQVVTAEDGTTRTTTSTSFVTGSNTLSVDITPSATSSKIFVVCHTPVQNTGTGENAYYTIFRDSTNLGDSAAGLAVQMSNVYTNITMTFLDSPSSTSQLTYQVYMKGTNGNTAKVSANGPHAVITAFEIGA